MLALYISANPQISKQKTWTFLYVITLYLFQLNFLFLSCHYAVLLLWLLWVAYTLNANVRSWQLG